MHLRIIRFGEICSFRYIASSHSWPHGKEPVSQEEFVYILAVCTAIALRSIHLFQNYRIVFFSPTHTPLPIRI